MRLEKICSRFSTKVFKLNNFNIFEFNLNSKFPPYRNLFFTAHVNYHLKSFQLRQI